MLKYSFSWELFQYMDLGASPVMRENDEELWRHLKFWREIRAMTDLDNWSFVNKKFSTFFNKIAVDRMQ